MIECDKVDESGFRMRKRERESEGTQFVFRIIYETRRPSIVNEWINGWTDEWIVTNNILSTIAKITAVVSFNK